MGDWHLDPHGGEHGEVAVNVWEGLDEGRVEVLEEWVFWITSGDWHLEPQGERERGEVTTDVWEGLGEEKEAVVEDLFWLIIGDWHLALQEGEIAEVAEVCEGRKAETEEVMEDWLTIGDWHLEPQGGEQGEVPVAVGEGFDKELETKVVTGDWHLVLLGDEMGEVTERMELEAVLEGWFFCRLGIQ